MKFKDYYKTLGVEPSASDKDIKSAYRKLARKYHPDVSDHHQGEEKFKEVSEAYKVLKNKQSRAEFDEIRKYGTDGQAFRPPPGWQPGGGSEYSVNPEEFSEFFSSIFGRSFDPAADSHGQYSQQRDYQGAGKAGLRGQDVETDMPIFLEDTLSEASKPISYQLGGANKTLNVKIPAGVGDGEYIRLKGQGMAGAQAGPNGDLYVRIRLVPHPMFDVEGHNLLITLPLAPWEAALGTKLELPTLSGKVQLTIPANSQSGQRLRIKGKGLIKKQGGRGDLYALVRIVNPDNHKESLDEYWRQLANNSTFDPRAQWSK